MKKLELTFTALKVPIDASMIILAGWLAYIIRVSPLVSSRLPVRFDIDVNELMRVIFIVALLWIFVFAINKLYSTRRMSAREELSRIFYGISTGMMLVFTVIFFIREIFESRFIVLAAWILAVILVTTARMILRLIERFLVSKGYGQHRVIIIGAKETASVLIEEFDTKPGLGFKIIGSRPHFTTEAQSWVLRKHRRIGVDEIILTNPDAKRSEALKIATFCEQNHITFMYTADLLEAATSRLQPHTFAGVPMFEVRRTPLEGWGRIYKRIFDIIVSLLLIIITFPIQLVTALILLAERQGGFMLTYLPNGKKFMRVGEGGKPFAFYKFRSMIKDAHKFRFDSDFIETHGNERASGPLFKLERDPRITRFGAFIRRYSIDEIPQFYLVLFGKMSLIGPRPHFPEEVANYKPEWRVVMNVKPGITGMAQVSGRADLEFEDEVRLDLYYIENWSPLLDLNILFKTPWVVLTSRGAK